jgi:DNA mismatch endonuclease (patch repair protein)
MRRIRSRDTGPECLVRRLLTSMGYRYRLNVRDLPGTPDIVFRRRKLAIFVHGCFWHRHRCRFGRVVPRTRREFWLEKFAANTARDRKALRLLKTEGWTVLTVWECQLSNEAKMRARLGQFLAGAILPLS